MTVTIDLRRHWDGDLMRTRAVQPAAAQAALLDWRLDEWPVDAGVPAAVAAALSRGLAALGPIAGRWLEPAPPPGHAAFVPAPRGNLAVRAVERLTGAWPAAVVVTRSPDMVARLFDQAWGLQGQMIVVLAADADLGDVPLEDLHRRRGWADFEIPPSVAALVAPGVDGDVMVISAGTAAGLDHVLDALRQACGLAGVQLGSGWRPGGDDPVRHP